MKGSRFCLWFTGLFVVLSWGLGAQASPGATPVPTTAAASTGTYWVDPALVALGSVSAANVYYSYLAIGTAADSYVSGVYDGRLAATIASEVVQMNTNSTKRLQEILTGRDLSEDDARAIAQLIETYRLLNGQAEALIRFIADKNDDGEDYQRYRTQVWGRIQGMIAGR